MSAIITYNKDKLIKAEINLPASKSISNRALIIKAIGNLNLKIENLSNADDTVFLEKALASLENDLYAGEGGTTLRFLLAYLCLMGKPVRVTAAEPLMKRPIAQLISSLQSIGALFDFENEKNQLPLTVMPAQLKGGIINIESSTSSQFVSALMMIAPYLNGGLEIHLSGDSVSWPYVVMTGKVMSYFGVSPDYADNRIIIPQGNYISQDIKIEADWSAASFWYEIAALSQQCNIELIGLVKDSWQGDSVIAEMSKSFGIKTEYNEKGVVLTKYPEFSISEYFRSDLSGCPDLGLPLAAMCGGLNMTADLENLTNFRLKESDRAVAMQRGLYDLNVKTDFCGGSKFKVYSGSGIVSENRVIKSYNDHRVVMAFAPLAIQTQKIIVDHPEVVHKSYPEFFTDLNKAGFEIEFT